MSNVFAFIMSLLILSTFYMLYRRRNALWLSMAIIGLFSIGYYILPIFYRKWGKLDKVFENEIIFVQFISILFFAAIILGVYITEKYFKQKGLKPISFKKLDLYFIRYYKILFFTAFGVWLTYYFTNDLTSYSAEDFEAYFHTKTWYGAFLAALSNFAVSIMAVILGYRLKSTLKSIWFVIPYVICVIMLMVSGQRLTVIQPIFMLICALFLFGNMKKAVNLSIMGAGFLIVISPLMVYFREYQGTRGKTQAIEAISTYDNKGSTFDKALQSIVERADLLYVSTVLVKNYDNRDNFDRSQYLYSIAASFIPSVIYKNKPFALSDDGTMSGEISVQAWQILMGKSTGSLSAFGSISAYREGGLYWVILNGFLVGILSTLIYFLFAKGNIISRIMYVSIFIQLTIRNVPISFFYLVTALVPIIYISLALFLVNKMLPQKKLVTKK